MAETYHSSGHSYLACPRLLEIDPRHGRHWSKHPPCALARPCLADHDHEPPLPSGQGHLVNDFHWTPGARPYESEEHPLCPCGQPLVYADLDDLYDPRHLVR